MASPHRHSHLYPKANGHVVTTVSTTNSHGPVSTNQFHNGVSQMPMVSFNGLYASLSSSNDQQVMVPVISSSHVSLAPGHVIVQSPRRENGHSANNTNNTYIPQSPQMVDLTDKLKKFCAEVAASDIVVKKATEIMEQVLPPNLRKIQSECSSSRLYFACFVYMACIDIRCSAKAADSSQNKHLATSQNKHLSVGPDLTVSEILQRARIRLPELFQQMSSLQDAYPVTDDSKRSLLQLKRKYCITGPLFNKFEKIFDDIILKTHLQSLEAYKRLCWTLFIFTKNSCMREHCELVPSFYLLVCCINYTLSVVPAFLLKPPFADGGEHMLRLCSAYSANADEVRVLDSMVLRPLLAQLPVDGGAVDTVHMRDQYYAAYRHEGDINELLFLDHEHHLWRNTEPVKSNDSGASSAVPLTPVRSAVNTVQQLTTLLKDTHDRPSPQLQQYFSKCSMDPSDFIFSNMRQKSESFMQNYVEAVGANQAAAAQQRLQLGARLYYALLESLLKQEEERLSLTDFSHLLNNHTFHSCLLACSLEIVLTTYETTSSLIDQHHMLESIIAFPWILHVCEVQPFDFLKVIESVLRTTFRLSVEAMKHLQRIERNVLEKIVWDNSSCVHQLLRNNEVLQPVHPHNGPMEASTAPAQLYLSPRPHHPSQSPNRRRRSQSLNFFVNKVSRLGYQRLEEMCEILQVSDALSKVWTCFENCLSHRADLFRNRHLDQLMMCVIYAVFKALDREIKFKAIVTAYKSLPRAVPAVYKQVLIENGVYDTVIGFYNRVFMEKMKPFVMQVASKHAEIPLSPAPAPVRSPQPGTLSYQLAGRKNFYVSPMKESPFKTPMSPVTHRISPAPGTLAGTPGGTHISPAPGALTPRSQKLYCFGETGSTEKLRTINDAVKASAMSITPKPRRGSSSRSLDFDSMDDKNTSTGLAVKRARLSATPQCSKSLTFTEPTNNHQQ